MKPLSMRVFDVLTYRDCYPGVSLAGAVNDTATDAGRGVFKAIANHLGLEFTDTPMGPATAVFAWEDAATGFEIRAALTACGRAERAKERDREDDEQVTRELEIAARQSPEQIAAELAWWQANPMANPDRGQAAYEEGLRELLHKHREAATPVPVDLADSGVPGYVVTHRWDEQTGTWTPADALPVPVKTVTINWFPGGDLAGPTYVVVHTVDGQRTTTRYIPADRIDAERAELVADGWVIVADEQPGGAE